MRGYETRSAWMRPIALALYALALADLLPWRPTGLAGSGRDSTAQGNWPGVGLDLSAQGLAAIVPSRGRDCARPPPRRWRPRPRGSRRPRSRWKGLARRLG